MKRLKIAYISAKDPRLKTNWSGIPHFIYKTLENYLGDVFYLGPIKTPIHSLGKIINGLLYPFGKRYNYGHSKILAKIYHNKLVNHLENKKFDFIFSHGTTEISLLKTKIPIILTTDATIPSLIGYYPYFSNLLKFSIKESISVEKYALENASYIFYPSSWAMNEAKKHYSIPENKMISINYGANIENIPNKNIVLSRKFASRKCRLLFVGVDWERKGGTIAYNTLLELEARGFDAELTICGVIPPKKFKHPKMRVIPFLNKNNKKDLLKLEELYLNHDFFILPTRAECAGIVFCEASAFGLPILTTNTGGIPSYVVNNINGFRLDLSAGGKEYADKIQSLYENPGEYLSLVKSTYEFYEEQLNWNSWGKKVKEILLQKFFSKGM